MSTVRARVARWYKWVELRLYAYETARDPEVHQWIAAARVAHPPEEVKPVSEVMDAILGERPDTATP